MKMEKNGNEKVNIGTRGKWSFCGPTYCSHFGTSFKRLLDMNNLIHTKIKKLRSW